MKKFRFIETGIDTKPFLEELKKNDSLWQMVNQMQDIGGDLDPPGFLPLTMGVQTKYITIKNSDYQKNTPAYEKFPVLREWLKNHNANDHSRAAFFRLPPGGQVLKHIDDGEYYLDKDRYHFSLQGEYLYWVDGESYIIKPGTFFWFDNKVMHSADNISTVDRITFVFDVRHSPNNP